LLRLLLLQKQLLLLRLLLLQVRLLQQRRVAGRQRKPGPGHAVAGRWQRGVV
jgi:hypothetical protein